MLFRENVSRLPTATKNGRRRRARRAAASAIPQLGALAAGRRVPGAAVRSGAGRGPRRRGVCRKRVDAQSATQQWATTTTQPQRQRQRRRRATVTRLSADPPSSNRSGIWACVRSKRVVNVVRPGPACVPAVVGGPADLRPARARRRPRVVRRAPVRVDIERARPGRPAAVRPRRRHLHLLRRVRPDLHRGCVRSRGPGDSPAHARCAVRPVPAAPV